MNDPIPPRPKYPQGHRYYRSHDDLANDLSRILSLPISLKTKVDACNSFLWAWTEYYGKYKGGRYSLAARKQLLAQSSKGLRHDHAVPRKKLCEMLLALKTQTPSAVMNLLVVYCSSVIITHEEDRVLARAGLRASMPADWDGTDPYARYKACGIELDQSLQ